MKYQKHLFISSFLVLAINLLWAVPAFGQLSNQSTATVDNSGGGLSFIAVPLTFDFGQTNTPTVPTPAFSDPTIDTTGSPPTNLLPASKRLTISDTRNSGGFLVQLGAISDFKNSPGTNCATTPTLCIPVSNLKVATTTNVDGNTGTPCVLGNVIYEEGTIGPPLPCSSPTTPSVTALVNTTGTNFGDATTFSSPAVANSNNLQEPDSVTPTIDVLDGTLPSGGRIGLMSVGVSTMLTIPALQAASQYKTTLTWTLQSSP